MFEKAKPARDAFAFSLGGMTAKSSFVIAPAIADDRINKIRDEHVRRTREARDENRAAGWKAVAGQHRTVHNKNNRNAAEWPRSAFIDLTSPTSNLRAPSFPARNLKRVSTEVKLKYVPESDLAQDLVS